MLAAIRAFAKSPFAVLLMGVLIIAFASWGVKDAFRTSVSNWVIKAGGHEVSEADYKQQFDAKIREAEQQLGRGITPDEAVAQGADKQILAGMSDNAAMAELVSRLGVKPDDKLVLAELARNPAFTDPLTGKFSDRAYKAALNNARIRPDQLEAEVYDQIAERHFAAGLGGAKNPRIYAAMMATYLLEGRSADYVLLDTHSVPAPVKPTDAQLLAFMKENAARMKRPEFRVLSMVRFSPSAVAPSLTPDPAAIQKRFDLEKASLSSPERRAFVQIMLKDKGQAQAAAARLAKGEAPDAVAKAYGVTATSYPATSQRAIPAPAVGAAVFSLQPGQSSGPIATEFGTAVVKLVGVTPAKAPTLDEARPKIVKELNDEAAQQKVFEVMKKYSDANDAGAPLAKAAQAAGTKVYVLGPLTADGVLRDTRQKEQSLNAQMLSEAFSLPVGGETELRDLGKGEYYALHVDSIIPSALPTLEEVRGPLTVQVMQIDLAKRLQAKADAISARIEKGEPLETAAAGLPVRHVTGINRINAREHQDLGQEFLGKMLSAKPGSAFVARTNAGVAVGKIGPATAPPPGAVAMLAQQANGQLNQMMMGDLVQTLRSLARDQVKPKVNMAKARQAIGLADADSSAKPAKGG